MCGSGLSIIISRNQFQSTMNSQSSHKRQLIESIKNSIVKPLSNSSVKSPLNKKPDNYTSYLNTAIDYSKDHSSSPYLSQNTVVLVDSDQSVPKEQPQYNHQDDATNKQAFEDEFMLEIQKEIYQGSPNDNQPQQRENNQIQEQTFQRKNVKAAGPRRTTPINKVLDLDEDKHQSRNSSKTPPQQNPISRKRTLTAQKESSISEDQPSKKLNLGIKDTPQLLNVKVKINLLKANLNVMRIKECTGNSRQQVRYVCELDNGRNVVLGNTEMTYFYKDALIDYYQNCHFS